MRWLAVMMVLAGPALADETAIETAWRTWVAEVQPSRSALAITKDGALVATFGFGMDANGAVPVASLSKAITGACIASLVKDGRLAYDMTVGEVFANRPDPDWTGSDIPIAALLTQTSGVRGDSTQTLENPALWGAKDTHDAVTDVALSRETGAPSFFYSNENYAILGSVIKEVTGQSVHDACAPRVLATAKTARPDPLFGGSLAWGGWSMSVADYALFAASLEVSDDWPRGPLGGGAEYGPGVFMRDTANGTNLWHFGAYCTAGRADAGAYFYVLDNGWGVAVAYDLCLNDDQARALDNGLARAAYAD